MPRSTPEKALKGILVAALCLGTLTSCSPEPGSTVFSGRFSPDSPIRLVNQTISGGPYLVGFSMEVLFSPAKDAVTLTCHVIDTSGRIGGFTDLSRTIVAGGWTRITAQQSYDLPDLTLGIRCSPDTPELLTVEFRDVLLNVSQIG